MILAATTVSSVALASRSAILGYHQSALVCILHCSIRFRGQDEKATSNRNCCVADGNIGIGPIFWTRWLRQRIRWWSYRRSRADQLRFIVSVVNHVHIGKCNRIPTILRNRVHDNVNEDEKAAPSRSCGAAPGNRGSARLKKSAPKNACARAVDVT